MKTFQIGETVICYLEIKRNDVYVDPVTSLTISIYLPSGVVDVNAADMLPGKEAIGKYAYNYQTSGKPAGIYRVMYKATDGTKITIQNTSFKLE